MKDQSIEDILAAVKLTEAMQAIGKEGLEQLVERKATGIEKRIAQAKAKKDGRAAAGKKRARLNYQKRWMRAKRLKVLEAIPTEGFYGYFLIHKDKWKISREEWEEHVEPCLGDEWIAIHKYDGSKAYTLDNIYIQDESTTIFDGKEWSLKQLGASPCVL